MIPSAAELIYFLELSSTLNFSRAAEKIGISQPSLSLAIQRLEHSLSTKLFIRHKHGVSLTHTGKQLIVHARQLQESWEKTKASIQITQEYIQGHFTLGSHPSVAIYLISKILPPLLEKHPKLDIQLKTDLSRHITAEVINSSMDIGVVMNPIKHPDLIIRKILSDEMTFFVADGKNKIQDIYSSQGVIICDPSLAQTQTLLKRCKKLGIPCERILSVNDLQVVAALVANKGGIGILPQRVAHGTYANKLKRVPNMPTYADELCLIYRDENRHMQAIRTILDAVAGHSCR